MNVRQVVPKDAIPSVDDPEFRDDHEPAEGTVVALVHDGDARAYPLRYLDYHEIVNDVVGGVPVAVTWCPLCGSAVVYDRRVDEISTVDPAAVAADELSFGVSGKLADDDLVMYDRETDTEWKQSSGVAIAGPLDGAELAVRPATVTTWARFAEAHPDARGLAPPGGESEAASATDEPAEVSYDERPYADYFEADGFGLAAHRGEGSAREWPRDDIAPKAVVLGVELAGDALGVPLPELERAGGVATVTVGGTDVVVAATDAGIHAFVNPGTEFASTEDGLRADGTTWDPVTGHGEDGRSLDRVPARRLFAFAWRDDHGDDAFWTNG
jgi:hypothetical protein